MLQPADELNVTFSDVGALESIKTTLRELVLLPLTRPELFRRGQLRKPSKGVLLFGPPGTGKVRGLTRVCLMHKLTQAPC